MAQVVVQHLADRLARGESDRATDESDVRRQETRAGENRKTDHAPEVRAWPDVAHEPGERGETDRDGVDGAVESEPQRAGSHGHLGEEDRGGADQHAPGPAKD